MRPLRIRPLLAIAEGHRPIRLAGRHRRHARFTTSRASPDEGDTLMPGCFERVLSSAASRAAVSTPPGVRVAREHGCCDAPHAHNGDLSRGEQLATDLADRPGRIVSTAGATAGAADLAALADLDLDFLVVVNPGCQRQLKTAARRAGLRTEVVHLAELVASVRDDH